MHKEDEAVIYSTQGAIVDELGGFWRPIFTVPVLLFWNEGHLFLSFALAGNSVPIKLES